MPPKKRARVSQNTSPAPTSPQKSKSKTPAPETSPSKPADDDVLNDPWTVHETTGLFKAVIKHKPTGTHKHAHMLTIYLYLLRNNYIHPASAHTRIPGIWAKLGTLYDLKALDEREDARQLSDIGVEDAEGEEEGEDGDGEDDVYSEAGNKIHRGDFALPEEEEEGGDGGFFAREAWGRRFRESGSESPGAEGEGNLDREPPVGFLGLLRREGEGVGEEDDSEDEEEEDDDEEEEEEAPAEVETSKKRGRGRPKGSTSAAKAKAEVAGPKERRRSTRAAPEEEDDEEDSEDDEDDEDEDEDEESSEEDDEGSEETTPAPRSGRSGRGRGRPPARGGSGVGRGRPKKK